MRICCEKESTSNGTNFLTDKNDLTNPKTNRMKYTALLTVFSLIAISCQQSKPIAVEQDHSAANKAIIEQYFTHFNNHDWQKMVAMYIAQPEMKDPAYGLKNVKMSHNEIVKKYSELQKMIPDVQDRVVAMYPSENHVIVEFESSGTGPDGKKFSLPICTIFEIKDGKISKDLTYYDNF